MKKLSFIILVICFFFSCSHESLTENKKKNNVNDSEMLKKEALLIDKESINLSSEDAQKVALLFSSAINEVNGRSANDLDFGDLEIRTIMDTTLNVPLLYIINRKNNNGYVVVNANKKGSPILIFSDTGYFELEADLASKHYLEDYKMRTREAYKDESDSLRVQHSLEWAVFEKAEPALVDARASSTAIDQMIQNEINSKVALGYTYMGKIAMAAYYLSPKDYQNLIMDISTHSDPAYNYEEVSLFFIKSYKFEQVGPLINTKWHQRSPFNINAPNGFAGCVPIALAQIAYYHKYPDKYNWNQIFLNPVLNDDFSYFITDIRNLCDVEYKPGGTSSDYKKAIKAMKALGYSATEAGLPDFIKLRNEMKTKNPVYIRGINSQTNEGHAWICEGYQNVKYEGVISMVIDDKYGVPSEANSVYFDYLFSAYPPSSLDQNLYGEFYYMNMGWEGINNGWYRANSYNPNRPEYSFLKDQKMITIKK